MNIKPFSWVNTSGYDVLEITSKRCDGDPKDGLVFISCLIYKNKEILEKIKNKGVNIAYITLHVGLGTFRPVKEENIEDHKMHSEYYEISKEACDIINETKKNNIIDIKDMNIEEIAEITGKPKTSIKTTISSARKQMLNLIEKYL